MDEPTLVDPMSDDRVNAEFRLRPIKGSGGWEFEKPGGLLEAAARQKATSEGCEACCAAVGFNRLPGEDAGDCKKLADAGGGSLNEVPRGESRRFQLSLVGLVIGFWEAFRTPSASGVFDRLPVLSRRPVAGRTTWSRPRVALRSVGKTIQRRRGEDFS